jgi:putative transposase
LETVVTHRAFKFRAYPTKERERAFETLLETHRHLYNDALRARKDAWEQEKRSVSYKEQSKQLTADRKVNPHLAAANFSSCQRTLRNLDKAFVAFFRRLKSGDKPGYPRFRGRGRFDSVEFTVGDGAKITKEGKAYFQGVGEVRVKLHRAIEGKVKTIRFRRQADGWFVIVSCDIDAPAPEPSELPSVGIDMGLKSFLVTSDGEKVKPPRFFRKAQRKLRRLQRSVARKKKGGANRRKAVARLAKFSQHVADQRRDFHHKTAKSLVDRFGRIAHEDLNVSRMSRGLNLGKSTHDAGWSGFLAILSHKAESAGVEIMAVDPRNTTQACSRCGCLPDEKLTLGVRVYECARCGLILDRDVNAAINIRNRAWTEPLGANQEGCLMDCPGSLPL